VDTGGLAVVPPGQTNSPDPRHTRSALAAAIRDALKMPPLSSADDTEDSIPIRPNRSTMPGATGRAMFYTPRTLYRRSCPARAEPSAAATTNSLAILSRFVAFCTTEMARPFHSGWRHLARRFFSAADEVVTGARQLAVNADLALPEVFGRRTPSGRFLNGYVGRGRARRPGGAPVHADDRHARLARPPVPPRAQTWSFVRRWPVRVSSRRSATGCPAQAS
jgi:hypothetical protein